MLKMKKTTTTTVATITAIGTWKNVVSFTHSDEFCFQKKATKNFCSFILFKFICTSSAFAFLPYVLLILFSFTFHLQIFKNHNQNASCGIKKSYKQQ